MNSTSVSVAEIPTVIRTFVSHYISKKNSPEKPTSHLRYDQGLNLVRGFIDYSSTHTVEELQSFTSQWVPHPTWVRVQRVTVPSSILDKAAVYLQAELGEEGLAQVGGRNWWQWRLPGSNLDAEWVEMKSDYQDKQERENDDSQDAHQPRRVMFYLHGGAYYFGGVNEHRYQLQRHARKLKARVFAPEYRLAPQFPFPCGLQDALAAYMSLLVSYNPTEIIFAGDSAGGALALSLLVVLRNQNLPLPAGAILLSPWVDLSHSFPSVTADPALDYVPSDGFHHKPSKAWPPPTYEEWEEMCKEAGSSAAMENASATKGDQIASTSDLSAQTMPPSHITIVTDNEVITVKEQVQMYAPNHLLSHPLVSPIMQPTLGGLPPIMIVTGGAELLRDEQIFIAHKLANPQRYAAPDLTEAQRAQVAKYPPTLVQLQVWDHLCHVATTLSFTEPAKYMFRSIAQFGAWALNVPLDATGPPEDGADVPGTTSSVHEGSVSEKCKQSGKPIGKIGGAGEPLPQFVDSMIRQRVDKNGNIYDLAPAFTFPFCDPPDYTQVGKVKPVPIKRWLSTRAKYDSKYARIKRDIRKEIIEDIRGGFIKHGDGENPPLSALAGRYLLNPLPRKSKLSKITVPHAWSLWGSKHDEHMMQFRRKQREAHEAEEKEMQLNAVTSQDSTGPQSPSTSSSVSPSTIADGETVVGNIDSSVASPNTPEETESQNTELLNAVTEKQPGLLKNKAEKEVEAQSILSGQSSCLSSDTSGSSLGQTRGDKFYEAQEAIGINNEESNQDTSLSTPQESELASTFKPPLPPRPSAEKVTSEELEVGMERATDNVAPDAASEEQQGLAKPAEVVQGKLVGKAAWTPPESPVRVRPRVSTTNLPSLDPLSPISPISLPLSRDAPAIPNLSALIPEKPTNPPPEIPKSAQTAKSIRSVKSTKSTNSATVKSPKSPRSPKSLNRTSPTRDILNSYSAPTTAPPQKELPKLPPGQLPKITLPRTQLPPAVNLNPWEASAPPTTALPPLPKMARTSSDRKDPSSPQLERFPTQVDQPLEGEDDPENVLSLVDSKAPIASIPTKELVPSPGVRKLSSPKSVPPLTVDTVMSTPAPPPKDLDISQDQDRIATIPSIGGVEAFSSSDVFGDKKPEDASFSTNNFADRLDPLDGSAAHDGTQGKDSQIDTAQEAESLATVATPHQSSNSWDHLVEVSPPLPEKDLPRPEKVPEAPSPTKSAKPGRKRLWPWSRSTEKNNTIAGPVPSTQQAPGSTEPNNPPVYSTLSPETSTHQQSWTRFPAWRSQVDMLIDQRRTREKEKAAKGEVETGVVGKRPMLGGIALPFSLGRKASTESLRTLHSDEAVEPQLK